MSSLTDVIKGDLKRIGHYMSYPIRGQLSNKLQDEMEKNEDYDSVHAFFTSLATNMGAYIGAGYLLNSVLSTPPDDLGYLGIAIGVSIFEFFGRFFGSLCLSLDNQTGVLLPSLPGKVISWPIEYALSVKERADYQERSETK